MAKEEKNQINPLKINKETLSQLDDEQLRQIAGGAVDSNSEDSEECEESCSYVGHCNCSGGPG